MLKKEENKPLAESVAEAFKEMVEEDISKRGYDLYRTSDGNYNCRECTSIVQHLQNCPNCKKIIDWTKIRFNIEEHIVRLLKDDKMTVADWGKIKEYQVKVRSMADDELMNYYGRLYDNLDKQDVALLATSNHEVRRRFLEAEKFLSRLFNRKQYEKWNSFITSIEVKATKFALEKYQKTIV